MDNMRRGTQITCEKNLPGQNLFSQTQLVNIYTYVVILRGVEQYMSDV